MARTIFLVGVEAADPGKAVARALRVRDGSLEILSEPGSDASPVRAGLWTRVHLVAFGKAACAMAAAAREIVPAERLAGEVIAITNYENVAEIPQVRVFGAGHPLPDEAGHAAARTLVEQVKQARAGELVLVLISGGGSALVPYPPESITLADKIATTELLLACGAPIEEINAVRKHLSLIKGGGLARLAAPADLQVLLVNADAAGAAR